MLKLLLNLQFSFLAFFLLSLVFLVSVNDHLHELLVRLLFQLLHHFFLLNLFVKSYFDFLISFSLILLLQALSFSLHLFSGLGLFEKSLLKFSFSLVTFFNYGISHTTHCILNSLFSCSPFLCSFTILFLHQSVIVLNHFLLSLFLHLLLFQPLPLFFFIFFNNF
jgi:hypothetical protein